MLGDSLEQINEQESHKMLTSHISQYINFQFTGEVAHDIRILNRGFLQIKHSSKTSSFETTYDNLLFLKGKLDLFFQTLPQLIQDSQIDLVSDLCVNLNMFIQLLLENKNTISPIQLIYCPPITPRTSDYQILSVEQIQNEKDRQEEGKEEFHLQKNLKKNNARNDENEFSPEIQELGKMVHSKQAGLSNEQIVQQIQKISLDQPNKQIQEEEKIINETLTKISEIMNNIKYLYDEKLLDKAIKLRDQLTQTIQTIENKYPRSQLLREKIKVFKETHFQFLTFISSEIEEMQTNLKWLEIEDGWIVQKEKGDIHVRYRQIEGSSMIALKIDTIIDINIQNLLSLIYEIDLYPQWFPFMKQATVLKQPDKCTQIVYLKQCPPVVNDRQLYVQGVGIDRMEENRTIVIMSKTIDQNKDIQKYFQIEVPTETKFVRVDIKFFTFQIQPLNENRMQMVAVSNLDAQLQYIPNSIINFVLRKFSCELFTMMLSKGKNFENSPWDKKIKENPQFYNWIDDKMKIYFPKVSQNQEGVVVEQSEKQGK